MSDALYRAMLADDIIREGEPVAMSDVKRYIARCREMSEGGKYEWWSGLADLIERLEREMDHFKNSGIVEVAVRNARVLEYMRHWEGRAERAEAKLEEAEGRARKFWQAFRDLRSDIIGHGPMCRDCADEDGRCPHSGRPCDTDEAVKEQIAAWKANALASLQETSNEA